MTRVRVDYRGGAYVEMDLVRYDPANAVEPGVPPGNTWVLQEDEGSVVAIDADDGRIGVEVQCDTCGRFADDVNPTPDDPTGQWQCLGGIGPCTGEEDDALEPAEGA